MKRFYMNSCLVVFLLININTSVLGESLTQWEPTEKNMHSLVKDGYKIVGVTSYQEQQKGAHVSHFVLQKGESVFSCSQVSDDVLQKSLKTAFCSELINCTDVQIKGVSAEELHKALKEYASDINPDKAPGFFELSDGAIYKKNAKRQHSTLVIANSDIGSKYIKIISKKGNEQRGTYKFGLTDEAIAEGSFKEGRNLYIPIGTVKYEIIEQQIDDLQYKLGGQQNIVRANYEVNLNELGQMIKELFDSPTYQDHKFRLKTNGKLKETFFRKSEKDPWKLQ